jgi:hypothetical protein
MCDCSSLRSAGHRSRWKRNGTANIVVRTSVRSLHPHFLDGQALYASGVTELAAFSSVRDHLQYALGASRACVLRVWGRAAAPTNTRGRYWAGELAGRGGRRCAGRASTLGRCDSATFQPLPPPETVDLGGYLELPDGSVGKVECTMERADSHGLSQTVIVARPLSPPSPRVPPGRSGARGEGASSRM